MTSRKRLFVGLALLLSHVGCIHVSGLYVAMQCAGDHLGYSASPSVAYFCFIPYGLGVAICLLLALFFHKKAQ